MLLQEKYERTTIARHWVLALHVVASASESADTCNWQTITHSIYYTRVPVSSGSSKVEIILSGSKVQNESHTLDIDIRKGETQIYSFYSLGAYDP